MDREGAEGREKKRVEHLAAGAGADEVAGEVGRAARAGALEHRALGRRAQAVQARRARHEAQLRALLHQPPDPPVVAEFLHAAHSTRALTLTLTYSDSDSYSYTDGNARVECTSREKVNP